MPLCGVKIEDSWCGYGGGVFSSGLENGFLESKLRPSSSVGRALAF